MKENKTIELICFYCERIISYSSGLDNQKDFASNQMVVDAVIFNLEQIGEKAKKIS